MAIEEQVINSWTFKRLTTTPALFPLVGSRVYLKRAPQGTTQNPITFPLIRYIPMSHVDISAIKSGGPARPWTRHRYTVGAVQKVSTTFQLKTIMDIVDDTFNDVTDYYQGLQISSWRTGVLDPAPYTIGSDEYLELQIMLQIMAQKVA